MARMNMREAKIEALQLAVAELRVAVDSRAWTEQGIAEVYGERDWERIKRAVGEWPTNWPPI